MMAQKHLLLLLGLFKLSAGQEDLTSTVLLEFSHLRRLGSCGNGKCGNSEDCNTCPADCGACPTPFPTNPPTPLPTNPPPTPPPTPAPVTAAPTPAPVTLAPTVVPPCLCCFGSPGFGDYFKIEQGGVLSGGTYGTGEVTCTAAFTEVGSPVWQLTRDICNVQLLPVGGGGGGGAGSGGIGAGGGGAGEVQKRYLATVTAGNYQVVVGGGGNGGESGYQSTNGGLTSVQEIGETLK